MKFLRYLRTTDLIGSTALAAAVVLLSFAMPALAQDSNSPATGKIIVPASSIEHPGDAGVRFHTNYEIFVPAGGLPQDKIEPAGGPPITGYSFETPASIACLYGLASKVSGCNPNAVTTNPVGGSKVIAIVDAYDDPNAESDLATFSTQFGLPAANFEVVYQSGSPPQQDPTGGWEGEESLDVQWAHAMAPHAKIILVEANSDYSSDLFAAEKVATAKVAAAGGGEVSNSWGGSEFGGNSQCLSGPITEPSPIGTVPGIPYGCCTGLGTGTCTSETGFDSIFSHSSVVAFASTGDNPGTEYPSVSPNVVAAGGTSIVRNSSFNFARETTWDSAGGGLSQFEPRPSYQNGIKSIVGSRRGVPDFSSDANPQTGVWIYDSFPYEGTSCSGSQCWMLVGGTSVSSPTLAGIVNSAGHFSANSAAELSLIYSHLGVAADFNDITLGFCGDGPGYSAVTGWDACTGVGSDNGKAGK